MTLGFTHFFTGKMGIFLLYLNGFPVPVCIQILGQSSVQAHSGFVGVYRQGLYAHGAGSKDVTAHFFFKSTSAVTFAPPGTSPSPAIGY